MMLTNIAKNLMLVLFFFEYNIFHININRTLIYYLGHPVQIPDEESPYTVADLLLLYLKLLPEPLLSYQLYDTILTDYRNSSCKLCVNGD